MHDVPTIRAKFEALRPYLDERRRRLWAAAEAMVLGHGAITAVATATGLERNTIRVGIHELQASPTAGTETEAAAAADRVQRVRAVGGGRRPLTTEDRAVLHDLEALVEPVDMLRAAKTKREWLSAPVRRSTTPGQAVH